MRNKYLARIRIDDAHVGQILGTPDNKLLHVAPHVGEACSLDVVLAEQVEKLDHVPQEFLRDPLARGVDADFDARRAEEHRRSEHAHADRLPETARRADQDLLLQMTPVVASQDFALLARKFAGRLSLPEDPCARPDEIVVEEALVVTPPPPVLVEEREGVAAALHAAET